MRTELKGVLRELLYFTSHCTTLSEKRSYESKHVYGGSILDQNTWTIISNIIVLVAALAGGAAGAILTSLSIRKQERRRKEMEVIEELYAQALKVRRSIDPSLISASSPSTRFSSTWQEPMIRMAALADLYLPSLKSALARANKSIMGVEEVFTHVSYEKDNYGHAIKRILPGDFDQRAEEYKESFKELLAALQELAKKRH